MISCSSKPAVRILSLFVLVGFAQLAGFRNAFGDDAVPASAEVPVTLATVTTPKANTDAEPLMADFSLQAAARFLDSASLSWQKERKCFTCHTNFAYLYARPLLDAEAPAHVEVRRFAEELILKRWPEKGPRWDAEVIAAAGAMAFNDAHTTGKLHAATKTALDRMWTIQRDDGGWDWLDCHWPPMEFEEHYGVTLAAIAAGVAPDDYLRTELAQTGMAKLRNYLSSNPPTQLHEEGMLLWAARFHENLISQEFRKASIDRMMSLQHVDGGWSASDLGDWARDDGTEQSRDISDGYGTGFVLFVLHQAGVPSDSRVYQRGISWLKSHQRQSGRWFTRSLFRDNKHFLSHAGSAFAVMALRADRTH